MTIIKRTTLGRPLTWAELDNNFEQVDSLVQQSSEAVNTATTAAQQAEQAKQDAQTAAASAGGAVNTFKQDLASSDTGKGDSLIGVKQPFTNSISRTQHDKNREFITASDFGCSPSQNDNTSSFNNAFLALKEMNGGVLKITEPGVYLVSDSLNVFANTTIEMSSGVVIRRNYTSGNSMINLVKSQGSNVKIRGGEFDGNAQNMGDAAFDILVSSLNSDLLFENVRFSNVCDFHAIDIAGWKRVVIRNCIFSGFKLVDISRNYSEAIQLDPGDISIGVATQSSDILIENCFAIPNSVSGLGSFGALVGNHANSYGIQDENIRIINCTTDSCGFAGVRVFNWKNYLIQGCTFKNSQGRGIHVTPYPNSVKPQGSRHGKLIGNIFLNVRSPVLLASPTWPFTDNSDAWHDFIEITNNTFDMTESLAYAIDARWCKNIVVDNNVGKGGLGLISLRFSNKFNIRSNTWSDSVNNAIWVAETEATTFIGTGLTYSGIIDANNFENTAYNGVHINCKANGVVIKSNLINGASTVANTRCGINVDSASSNILIDANIVLDGGASFKPQVGISATSSCTNVKMLNNISFGTVSPVNNQATGESTLTHNGPNAPSTAGIGAPVGSVYTRTDGGANSTLYIKESGTSAVGWVAK